MQWIDFPDERFTLNGLYWWEETQPTLWRLPDRMREAVPPAVWGLSGQPSGARLRFSTDSGSLGIRLHYPNLGYMNNMPRTGQAGVDLWVDGEYWRPIFPTDKQDVEETFFADLPPQRREICLYLGLYMPVEVLAVGLDEGAGIAEPTPFAVSKPVAYYGSSITQGGCASRAGMSYQAILSRKLNLDFINLGFSGAGRGEPALADAMAEIDASCYVVDFCQNCQSVEELETNYAPFLATLRDSHPQTPIICVTPIFSTSEVWSAQRGRLPRMREIIRAAVAERQQAGDEAIEAVEGYDMLGPDDREGLVDATHPNDIGFVSMATGLEPALRRALGM